jgi:hypothetical protein
MLGKTKPHENPVTFTAAVKALKRANTKTMIVAHAMYSPDTKVSERILAFKQSRSRIRKIIDFWLDANDIPRFKEAASAIGELVLGQCDAMYATSPKLVWGEVNGLLYFWQKGHAKMQFCKEHINIRRRFGNWDSIPTSKFNACYAFLSPNWVTRGLKLTRPIGPSLLVTKRKELMAFLDPTYDGLDLMADTAWLVDFSRAVSSATNLQLRFHKDLK